MADSILRLKVDSQEYDNKLKRAAEGLQRYAEGCRKAGGTLTQLDDGVEDFVKELGKMETVSKSAKGSINEMTKAFTDLSVQYNRLTDEEKNSPFGKALAQSLETLKGRIQEGNNELKNISGSINDTGGFLNTLKDKFTINIDALKLFNAGVTAAKAALDVAKDAFFASESNVDEWGRTVAAAEGVYDSFLQALNTGDFSGFLGHLDEIIKKAKDAYNALDELNTRMTIINPERTRLQARATELKAMIRRNGRDSEAGKAAQTELKQLEGMLTQAFKTESQLNMNAFKAQVDKKLQDAGIKLGERDYNFLMRTFSSDASYMAMRRGAKGSAGRDYEVGGSYDEPSTTSYDTRNMNQRLLDLFTDEWRKEYAPLLNAAFSARGGAASTMLSDARYLNGGGGSGGGGGRGGAGGGFDFSNIAFNPPSNDKVIKPEDYIAVPSVWEQYGQEIAKSMSDTGDAFDQAIDKLSLDNWSGDAEVLEFLKKFAKYGDDAANSWRTAASAISAVGSAVSGLDDNAGKIMSIIGEAIANIAAAAGIATKKAAGETVHWTEYVGAAAGIIATMVSAISTIHSSTGYAHGGMVEGNTYSGDQIPIMANAGEVVLNQAQQSNVAHALQGGAMGGMHLTARLDGKDLLLSIDRTGQTMGYGQLVFFK